MYLKFWAELAPFLQKTPIFNRSLLVTP